MNLRKHLINNNAMPHLYNNTLVVTFAELRAGDNPIMSNSYYKNNSKELHTVRRGTYQTPALYSYDSLPPDIKQKFIDRLGYDPEKQEEPRAEEQKEIQAIGYEITMDWQAKDFFDAFAYEDTGEGLADDHKVMYTNDASILNAWMRQYNSRYATIRNCGGSTAQLMQQELAYYRNHAEAIALKFPNTLPLSNKRFRERLKNYQDEGYKALISGKQRNQNSRKIKGAAGEWLVARFASPVNKVTLDQLWQEYNALAEAKGWKKVKSKGSIRKWLDEPENRKIWMITRHGELKAKEYAQRQHRTKLPVYRDALWYSDGTKLNYYYQYTDANGLVQIGTATVYEIIDAYSECFIGYAIGDKEDYNLQYAAFRMAVQHAGQKPYEIRFDNQGGHKKLKSADFLNNISKLSIATQPYNGKSKTIELAFGHFQQQYLHKDWFFTGQNIQAKREESKANMEMILANKANLPTLEEIKETYRQRRNEWNAAKHSHTGLSRMHMYRTSENPDCVKVDIWEMVNLFWMTTDKQITYRTSGIELTVNKKTYAFEVLTAEGEPNLDFLAKNNGKKFFVKYDPMDIEPMIHLYEKTPNGLRYIETAQPYLEVHRAVQDQQDGEMSFIRRQDELAKANRKSNVAELEELLEKHGYHPEQHGLNMPKIKGLNKRKAKPAKSNHDIGKIMKEESILDELTEENEMAIARKYY